jgi:peptide deformylase
MLEGRCAQQKVIWEEIMTTDVLLLGNPALSMVSHEITNFAKKDFISNVCTLKCTLDEFRKEYGFGRGIAAIQIGIMERVIALNIGEGTFCIINPKITRRSIETFQMWDDCMSFPDIVVKVKRNTQIDIEYQDEKGKITEWKNISQDVSELLQHEIDHLDGVLAIERAVSMKEIIYKSEYEKNKAYYNKGIEYGIK